MRLASLNSQKPIANQTLEWMAGERVSSNANTHEPATTQLTSLAQNVRMSPFKPDRESFGLGIIGVACMALLAAVGALIYSWDFVQHSARTAGQVIKLAQHQDEDSGTIYSPVFTFRDAQSIEHTVTSAVGSRSPEYSVGDAVRVRYRVGSPDEAKIDDLFSVWGIVLIPGLLGLFGLFVGVVIVKWPHSLNRSRKDAQISYVG